MSGHGETLWSRVIQLVEKRVSRLVPQRLFVGTETSGRVTLVRSDGSTGVEQFDRLQGVALSANDEVIVLPLDGGEMVVLGAIQKGAPGSTSVTWASITGKPSTFTPSSHTHAMTDIFTVSAVIVAGGPFNFRASPDASGTANIIGSIASGTTVYKMNPNVTFSQAGYTWVYAWWPGRGIGYIVNTALP